MERVFLDRHELRAAAINGVDRRIMGLILSRKGAYGYNNDTNAWQLDIKGAAAEAAVAKYLNQRWNNEIVEDTDEVLADVGMNIQVRSTMHKSGRLIVHDRDKDDQAFVLVLWDNDPWFMLAGWIWGRDAKQKEWVYQAHEDRHPAYYVPQSCLREMEELKELCNVR